LWNPDADVNFDGLPGDRRHRRRAAGLTLGLTLPAGAANEDAAASLEWNDERQI
jgi:hypothetical protein